MDVLVVGAGAVGRWFGATVDGSVAYADRERDIAGRAAEATGGRAVSLDTDDRFDVVCVAVPISATTAAIEAHAPSATRAILDCAGVMAEPLAAMREHAPALERASLHPLFAPKHAPGRVAVVRDTDGAALDAIVDAVASDHDVFETTAEEHDRAMSTIQARTHAAVLAYGLAAEPVADRFHTPVSERLTAIVDRVTDGNPATYAEIQATFEGADDVADAARRIAEADEETFRTLYRDAGR